MKQEGIWRERERVGRRRHTALGSARKSCTDHSTNSAARPAPARTASFPMSGPTKENTHTSATLPSPGDTLARVSMTSKAHNIASMLPRLWPLIVTLTYLPRMCYNSTSLRTSVSTSYRVEYLHKRHNPLSAFTSGSGHDTPVSRRGIWLATHSRRVMVLCHAMTMSRRPTST
jgi:hypothetical protein